MIREVRVTPNAGIDEVSEKDGILLVKVRAPAKDNKANVRTIKALKRHFKKDVRLVSGLTSKKKLVEISE